MEFGCRRLAIMFCRPSRLALLFSLVQILAAVDRFEPIRTLIRARLVETGVASIAVAVAKDGEIVWEQGFGWADHEKRIAATQTHFVFAGFYLQTDYSNCPDDAGGSR
jgi:CubicO group peptidase (beta-lactamase class C family)